MLLNVRGVCHNGPELSGVSLSGGAGKKRGLGGRSVAHKQCHSFVYMCLDSDKQNKRILSESVLERTMRASVHAAGVNLPPVGIEPTTFGL